MKYLFNLFSPEQLIDLLTLASHVELIFPIYFCLQYHDHGLHMTSSFMFYGKSYFTSYTIIHHKWLYMRNLLLYINSLNNHTSKLL